MTKSTRCLLTVAALLLSVLTAPTHAMAAPDPDAPIADPIPEDPIPSRLALQLTEVASFPKSDPVPPTTDPRIMRHARINYLGEVPDGSGRFFVPDLNGMLYLVKRGTPTPYLNVGAYAGADFWNHRGIGNGFGFVTFHPDFKRNGRFYTVHTEARDALTKTPDLPAQTNPQVHGVITEWTAARPSADTFVGTHREIFRLALRNYFHGIQEINFNPTAHRYSEDYGLLYVAVGDGGGGVSGAGSAEPGDPVRQDPADRPARHGQRQRPLRRAEEQPVRRTTRRARRDLRVRAAQPAPVQLGSAPDLGLQHAPAAQPHVPGRHRRAQHRGDLRGEARRQLRLDRPRGPVRHPRRRPDCSVYPLPADDAKFGYTYPVAGYDHERPPDSPPCRDHGYGVIGGFVYRGHAVPALRGKYVFGEDVHGNVFYTETQEMRRGGKLATIHEFQLLDRTGKRVTMADLAGDVRVDLRFGTDRAGELYILSKANGKIWKVTGSRWLPHQPDVHPSLKRNLVAYYDFEHPVRGNPAQEQDQGRSGTSIDLVNGGAAMRATDGAYPASRGSLQLQQVNPTAAGNDDWKAGTYSATGVPTLNAFNKVQGTTVMGWFKMTGQNPSPNSNSANPDDFYGAIGLAGVLSGDSDGHAVRALLELIQVNGVMRVVALGRRIDGSASQTFAASDPWPTILPPNEWVFLAATFDFNTGTMALYKNGRPLAGSYVVAGDPWGVGGPGPHYTSPTDPRGIKIGGSFPQNTRENNPCNCRMDSLMFLDRAVSGREVAQQYRRATTARP